MGKPKREFKGSKRKHVSVLGSDDEDLYRHQQADPKSRAFMYNEIDEFNENNQKIPLDSDHDDDEEFHARGNMKEEVLALPDSSDDDEDDEDDIGDGKFYSSMLQKDNMASDIDDDDDDDSLPNDQAWGKKKSSYYSTDYVDPDYGGFQGSDGEMAEAEEKEALKIQKRLLQQLKEEDFGLDWLDPSDKSSAQAPDKEKDRVSVDLSSLTDTQKLELLKKESPELLCVIEDFKTRMTELNEKILPLLPLVEDGRIPAGPGADYLTMKKKLILLYCTNISFYMMIRCRDVDVKHHPVIKRLLTFRKLLSQLKNVEEMLEPEIQSLLKMLKEGKDVGSLLQTERIAKHKTQKADKRTKSKLAKKMKKVKFLDETTKVPKKKAKMVKETADEKEALAMYNLMKVKNKKKLQNSDVSDKDSDQEEELADQNMGEYEGEVPLEKRGINYQIAKNKGLTPHRKKEYRNPRVRHRVKFQKAKVRRKGQFKEPRTETQRYGGEVSGIRIGSKRGIKLK